MSADDDSQKALKVQLKTFTLPAPDADLQKAFNRLNAQPVAQEDSGEAMRTTDNPPAPQPRESDDEEGAAGGQSG